MELYGRSVLDSFQSVNKLLKPKGDDKKTSIGVDGFQ